MDHVNPLLGPLVALAGWTLLVMMWMAVVRFRGFKYHNIDIRTRDGGRGADLDGKVEPRFQWPAHNYSHLLEQPTLFYAIVLALVAMGDTEPLNLTLAWAYVVIRVAHSLWQIFVNKVPVRFALFLLGSLCLVMLTVHAGLEVFAHR